MKRVEKIAFISFLSFTLLALTGLVVLRIAGAAFGGNAVGDEALSAFAADVADGGFILFVYSVLIGLSFLIFDIKWLNSTLKRALHLLLNYVLMTAAFMLVAADKSGKGLVLLVLTFVFIAVYYGGMLLCRVAAKLLHIAEEIKNSKKS